ncbi:L,D-transpeptidase [Paludibacterium yongneupense]|uniref:L,D-transpeptidase n=1 Tax=Paludibacterium yongneupense TaxID=400061 RepID=UPI0003F94B41|nr:L,D-transpeptidase [Paludibacterium yongneupense]
MGWLAMAPAWGQTPEPDVQVVQHGLQVVINLPQTRLFLYQDGLLVKSYPVAVGKMLSRTPTGRFDVTGIYRDPTWFVPRSIQDEMRSRGKPVQTSIPPGDDNPLGRVFIRFGETSLGLGIHGTNAPGSVPGFRSHGCVRMKNDDVLELASHLGRGTAVTVAYQPILLNEDAAGQLWLTAFSNPYRHDDVAMTRLAETLLAWQREHRIAVYGRRVDEALQVRNGKPVCLSCRSPARDTGELIAVRWLSAPQEEGGHDGAPSDSMPARTGGALQAAPA